MGMARPLSAEASVFTTTRQLITCASSSVPTSDRREPSCSLSEQISRAICCPLVLTGNMLAALTGHLEEAEGLLHSVTCWPCIRQYAPTWKRAKRQEPVS